MICKDYFPHGSFIKYDIDEIVQIQKDKIKSLPFVVPQRINKVTLKTETIFKAELMEMQLNEFNKLIKSLRHDLDQKNKKEIETMTLNERKFTITPHNNIFEDDIWILSNRISLLDFFREQYTDKQKEENLPKVAQDDLIDYVSKIDLHDMISLYESELYNTIMKNENYFSNLKSKIKNEIEIEKQLINQNQLDINDVLIDLKIKLQEDEQFLNMLEKRQSELKEQTKIQVGKEPAQHNNGLKIKPRVILEDMVCQICNDGDYAEDDLIVFCAVKLIYLLCF